MKTIIAGGRSYAFTVEDTRRLDALRPSITEVVSGAANGADRCGELWAKFNHIAVTRFPALWQEHGKGAGHIRNRAMATYAKGGQCILFPGGKGTANMRQEAIKAGLVIHELGEHRHD